MIQSLISSACPGLDHASVACVNHYAAVLPLPFSRPSIPDGSVIPLANTSFNGTSVPDPSFDLVHQSVFVVFDRDRGLEILGPEPTYEIVFDNVAEAVHEAPVYVPALNSIIVSTLSADVIPQSIIDLNYDPPTLKNYTTSPPIRGVNGGRFFDGTVYWVAGSGDFAFDGREFRQVPGLYALNPETREVKPILNNYFGQLFNSPDDLTVDPQTGDIFFTDPWFGWALGLTDAVPVLRQNTYRFRPSTGAVSIIDTGIAQPNGIALSPDGKTLYISDTGIANVSLDPATPIPRYGVSTTGPRSVYALDLVESPAGKRPSSRRPIYFTEDFIDDGLHVAANGFILGAAGFSVDVLSELGELLVKIQTDFYIQNLQFAGPDLDELWLFGIGKIARVRWSLKGQSGKSLG
ncbi:gluconolactonase [Thozetella sp. PMI_491]|nr:gluconolactonase [Thozetella sp. PMI_491]